MAVGGTAHPYHWRVVGAAGETLRDLDDQGRPESFDARFRRRADADRVARRYRRGGQPAMAVPHRLTGDAAVEWVTRQ